MRAVQAGADALGLVFFNSSSRCVSISQAQEILAAVPPFIGRVALTVDAESHFICTLLRELDIDWLQFHGNETGQFCRGFGFPWIKAVAMSEGIDLKAQAVRYTGAGALLLDAHVPGKPGGTGQCFDWTTPVDAISCPLILAGGLHAGNVATAIRAVRPYAVDVSSGVEGSSGNKDFARMKEFIMAVRNTDKDK